jgi:hypothetical protein
MPLVWSPIFSSLTSALDDGDSLALLIAPFVKLDALQALLDRRKVSDNLRVIIRLKPEDLVSGISDLAIYPFLREQGIPLFYNHSIHLKLFVFESNRCLVTSGNITNRGLGLGANGNVEAGAFVNLDSDDWKQIYGLLSASRELNDLLYERLCKYVAETPAPVGMPKFEWPAESPGRFTISSLPAAETVEALSSAYFSRSLDSYSKEDVLRIAHDLAVFSIPSGLSKEMFHQQLRESFCNSPFVTAFVDYLKTHGSLRFGRVNEWIHQMCEDVPLPYRWELKENTRIFYNWLASLSPEITWDRPNHSQVIYWNKGKT